jgi:hypothetical protein
VFERECHDPRDRPMDPSMRRTTLGCRGCADAGDRARGCEPMIEALHEDVAEHWARFTADNSGTWSAATRLAPAAHRGAVGPQLSVQIRSALEENP